jgi:hypothetical protein
MTGTLPRSNSDSVRVESMNRSTEPVAIVGPSKLPRRAVSRMRRVPCCAALWYSVTVLSRVPP